MKREDIKKIFEGATDEQISAVLNINSADIGNAKKKIEEERNTYKSQLETATTQLKDFEGVDVKDLQGKITTLNQQLETQKADYEKQLADNEFKSVIDKALSDSGAKNTTAAKALLDLKALRESKNQGEDIKAAIDKLKEENDYLFVSKEPLDNPVFVGGTGGNPPSASPLDTMRAIMGLPPEKK